MVPFPELALEVGHVELVGELQVIQVRERRGSNSLHDAQGTRIERAVHVGAQGKQALHVPTMCLDSFRTALISAPDLYAWNEGY
jgi:hypothetical protein